MALLKFKRSAVPAKIPSIADLALGELAINTYDGKVYTKKDDGTASIVEVGGSGGITTITSADGSVTVTGSGATRDLSVAVAGSTTNVVALVRNNTGATLAKGTVVYINGSLGQNSTVAKAIATSDSTSAQTLGLMTANLANNATGYVTVIGVLTGMDTSAFTDGQQLYLSPTTAGAFTATKPYAPNHLVYVAVVEHAHPSQGKLFVKVQNGYEMDELHDVSAQNPANNDGLFYNTTSGLWEKKSIATALGYTPANRAGDTFTGALTVPVNNTTSGGGINFSGQGSAFIRGTSGDGASNTLANLQLQSWFGIGFGPSISGQPIPIGENSVYIDVRNGDLTARRIITGASDVRAPIFYDSGNTAYYIDPASTSNLVGLTVANTITGSITGSAGSLSNTTDYFINRGSIAAASIDTATGLGVWNQANVGDSHTILAFGAGGSTSTVQQRFHYTGAMEFRNRTDSATWQPWKTVLTNTNYTSYSPSLTGSGASGTWAISVTGSARSVGLSDPNIGAGAVWVLTSDKTLNFADGVGAQKVMSSGVSAVNNVDVRAPIFYDSNNTAFYINPNSTSAVSGAIIIGPNSSSQYTRIGGDGGNTDIATLSSSNGNLHIDAKAGNNLYLSWYNTATTQVGGGIAATVFYDRDNTAYFIDPTASQSIRTVGDWRADSSAWTGEFSGKIQYHINNWYFQAAGSWEFRRSDAANAFSVTQAGLATAASSFDAPIFRDSANTAYYLDPVSGFNFAHGGVTYVSSTSGLYVTNAESTGHTVRVGAAYGRAGIYVNPSLHLQAEGTIEFWTGNAQRGYFDASSNLFANASHRAPIFYDSNDTGYFINPNGDTNLSKTFTYLGGRDTNGNWNTGFQNTPPASYNFHGDISSGGPAGTWWFYESMRHSNASNYWGTQIAWGWEDNANRLQQRNIQNGTFGSWVEYLNTSGRTYSGNLTMTGSIISSASDVRAPIFYDQNNTGYYVDPNGTGTSLNVAGNLDCIARSAAWSEGLRVRVPTRATWGGVRFTRDEGNSNGNWGIGYTGIDSTDDLTFWGNLSGTEGMRARLTQGGVFSVAGDVRAPVVYDSNDTAFYMNLNAGSRFQTIDVSDTIYSNNWFRSYGDSGWYSQTHGGGIFMQDATWVRVYNGKNFYCPADIAAAGNVTAYYSDERLKTKTGGIDNALEKVVGLSGFLYVENDLARSLGYTNAKQQVGVSAQAVQAVLPEAVSLAPVDFETLDDGTIISKSGKNYLTVDYSRLVPLLIEAIKELRNEVEALKNKE